MPGFKVHKKIGGIVALFVGILFILLFYRNILIDWRLLLVPFIVIIYSQLPDLDAYTSRIRKRALQFIFLIMLFSSIISIFINMILLVALLTLTGISGLLLLNVRHRGPLHTYWFVLIASLPMLLIGW